MEKWQLTFWATLHIVSAKSARVNMTDGCDDNSTLCVIGVEETFTPSVSTVNTLIVDSTGTARCLLHSLNLLETL